MGADGIVRARIDEALKDEAAAVLAELGLMVSDVVRMVPTRVAKDGALPLDLKVPNAETRAAMAESRAMLEARRALFADAENSRCPRKTVQLSADSPPVIGGSREAS